MIQENELMTLLLAGESDCLEKTTSIKNMPKLCEAVCAFANDLPNHKKPGYLLIGVQDDGSLSNLAVTDQLLLDLSSIRSDGNILPQPAMSVAKFALPGGDVAVIEVLPSDIPPVRYQGRVWVRVGPRKSVANEQEERILTEKRTAHIALFFDMTPVPDAGLDAMDLSLFTAYRRLVVAEETIEANHRSIQEQLSSLRLLDPAKNLLTVAGVLLFATNPRFYLPGAYVQFLRFPGEDMADLPVDQAEVSGDLRTVLDAVRDKLRAGQVRTMVMGDDLRDKIYEDYPEVAVREIFYNAICHRDYGSSTPVRFYWFSDRIEIQSPGGLYGFVTLENMKKKNSYRNPVIAEALKALGYINRFGYGVARAERILKENGNPPLEFQADAHTVCVILRKRML